jgi:uncharacterized membrane protein YcaP (DUF421 family)
MKKEDIDITDYMRILFGDMPLEFMVEVAIRVAFVYILLIATMRILGPRMEAMISRNEEITLVTLAASAGILIHNPDRGLLPALVVVMVVVGFQYLSVWKMKRSNVFEEAVLDKPKTLVDGGRFKLDAMQKTRIQRERLVAELRSRAVANLGEVERVYIEANGEFTVLMFEEQKPRTGLCILPDTDTAFRQEQCYSDTEFACKVCGNIVQHHSEKCPDCNSAAWEQAIITGKEQ